MRPRTRALRRRPRERALLRRDAALGLRRQRRLQPPHALLQRL